MEAGNGAGGEGASHLSEGDLVAWSDGTAADQRAARISAHLASCADCRRRLAEFREVGDLLRARYPLVDDPAARARIVARTSGKTQQTERAQAPGGPARRTIAAAWTAVVHQGGRAARTAGRLAKLARRHRPDG